MIVGVLGGGQLGRMLALAGIPLGLDVRCMERAADAPAAAVCAVTPGDPADAAAVRAFATGLDVLTYEVEGVATDGVPVPLRPPVAALRLTSDRWSEKQLLAEVGIPTARTLPVATRAGLVAAVEQLGACIVKTRTGGYDGRGQVRVTAPGDLSAAVALLDAPGPGLVVEQLVALDLEVSVVAARGLDGSVAAYPLLENDHRDGILRVSRLPARLPAGLEALALGWVTRLLEHLGYVGVLALELFVSGGELLANEVAPRVHNSGHLTVEACETGQFEQHLRAVTGLPLGSPAPRGPAAMVNLIGTTPDPAAVLAVPGAHLHLYGKAPRRGRKLGHVTITAPDEAVLEDRLALLQRGLAALG